MKKTKEHIWIHLCIMLITFCILQFFAPFLFQNTLYNVLFSILLGTISLLAFDAYKKDHEYVLFGAIFGTFCGIISLWAKHSGPLEIGKELFLSFFIPFIFMFIYSSSLQIVSNTIQSVLYLASQQKNES